MREIIRMMAVLMLLGLLQPAWADEIGHGGPRSDDPNTAPFDPVASQTGQEENHWWDLLLEWFDVTDSE